MSEKFYTSEKNVQILISLLKQYGIRKIIASPGTTNLTFVASLQQNPFFEIYSAPEERSGAYMAVGMAEESGHPVVITCTGATASRNYLPALTEAYYRKLPVIAVTATQPVTRIGQLVPQVIDRSVLPNDTHVFSTILKIVKDQADYNENVIAVNEAFHHLVKNGGGPVHINVETSYSKDFSVKELPAVRKISFHSSLNSLPEIQKGKVGIYVGSHSKMDQALTDAIDAFCASHNAVVFCDHTSNYFGKFRLQYPLLLSQDNWKSSLASVHTLVHIGEISGSYASPSFNILWRVNPDGMIRSPFGVPSDVFQLSETEFFNYYSKNPTAKADSFASDLNKELDDLYELIPADLPFSNIWCAKTASPLIPKGSILHFGILNSLRSWNFFRIPEIQASYSNVGGFGIDGGLSTLMGGALAKPDVIHYGIIGDLAFFYDLNSLGNRHFPSNIRILLINNGRGTEFRNYNHPGSAFGEKADDYIAAAFHYGNKSSQLVKHISEDLGFEYLSASSKEDFTKNLDTFLNPQSRNQSLVFEIFTTQKDEDEALHIMRNLKTGGQTLTQNMIRKALGPKGINTVKKIIGKN